MDANGLIGAIQEAADAGMLVARAVERLEAAPSHVLSIGKAGVEMADAALEQLGPKPSFVVGPESRVKACRNQHDDLQLFAVDHPVPTARNLQASRELIRWCRSLRESDRLLALVSGGGSAQLTLPMADLSISDIAELSDGLMRAGANIRELNSVRKRLDQIKGGRLASAVFPARCEVLVLSDVIGDALDVVSSGPLHADASSRDDAQRVLDRYGVAGSRAGRWLAEHPVDSEPPSADDEVFAGITHRVIGNHASVSDAAAAWMREQGFAAEVVCGVSGEAQEIGREAAARVMDLPAGCSVIWAGEPTVSGVPAGARGGPIQEAVLSCAVGLREAGARGWCVVGYATDGVDGPTDAAGAILSDQTALDLERARQGLFRHDAYPYLEDVAALVRPGPTGTNLNDVLVVWRTAGRDGPIEQQTKTGAER